MGDCRKCQNFYRHPGRAGGPPIGERTSAVNCIVEETAFKCEIDHIPLRSTEQDKLRRSFRNRPTASLAALQQAVGSWGHSRHAISSSRRPSLPRAGSVASPWPHAVRPKSRRAIWPPCARPSGQINPARVAKRVASQRSSQSECCRAPARHSSKTRPVIYHWGQFAMPSTT